MKANYAIKALLAVLLMTAATNSLGDQFTKITAGRIAQDKISATGLAWGDYDNDGYLDLFVSGNDWGRRDKNVLYRNQKDGTFVPVGSGPVSTDVAGSIGGAWADFDNDGWLDLYVPDAIKLWVATSSANHLLYRGVGAGAFEKITTDPAVTNVPNGEDALWGDFNNDGWVDLFVMGGGTFKNSLLFNNGAGGFTKQLTGRVATDLAKGEFAGASDFDNDGDLDLLVSAHQVRLFYRNQGDGTFSRITTGPIANDTADSAGMAWADYDNDGDIDLCVAPYFDKLILYNNDGKGNFTRLLLGSASNYQVPVWVDYDNDGWLDLFVTNGGDVGERRDRMFHNNGNGTFTDVQLGALTSDGGRTIACAWADHNNDGFPDLVVGNSYQADGGMFLYKNNGNTNHFLTVRLIGTTSNRSAIGAKVRAFATIAGRSFWQLREISGGCSWAQPDPRACFGLRNATHVTALRVEWPSGTVQELNDITADQFITITEPPRQPSISPRTVDLATGDATTLQLVHVPPGDVTFQWQRNDMNLPGATGTTLELQNVNAEQAGDYTAVVSSSGQSVTTLARTVRVFDQLAITVQPESAGLVAGASTSFSVRAVGPLPMTYQWRFNGVDLPARTNSLLAFSVTATNMGEYTVVVSDANASIVSQPATLAVVSAPEFAQAPLSQAVVAGGSVTLSARLIGYPGPFTCEWRKGSSFTTSKILAKVQPSADTAFFTLTNVQAADAGIYRLYVASPVVPAITNTSPNRTFTLTVLPDTDGDGLPDEWETANGLNPADPSDALLDSDGDGIGNLAEYRAGTDPTKGDSGLRLESVAHANGKTTITFAAAANQTYTIEASPQAAGGAWEKVTDVVGQPAERVEMIIHDAATGPMRFYRIITPRRP